jgi:hypothetical protein
LNPGDHVQWYKRGKRYPVSFTVKEVDLRRTPTGEISLADSRVSGLDGDGRFRIVTADRLGHK